MPCHAPDVDAYAHFTLAEPTLSRLHFSNAFTVTTFCRSVVDFVAYVYFGYKPTCHCDGCAIILA